MLWRSCSGVGGGNRWRGRKEVEEEARSFVLAACMSGAVRRFVLVDRTSVAEGRSRTC